MAALRRAQASGGLSAKAELVYVNRLSCLDRLVMWSYKKLDRVGPYFYRLEE